ncbi:DUF58 domain-containing protein [Halorhabdus sp. SVX81]|uniref:DUF58 domain-containing protein n=1 Tax=Halorhabdus sp. SVX81 TaxID=2978283 RepID=UPI0023D994F6|nr:DUF58 domain-containing protein [Halorhabdus sp. SVX81]
MRVERFRSMRAYAIILIAAGIVTATPMLVIAATLPLGFVLQGAVARSPSVEQVRVRRDLDPETPLPGQPVEVTLTVENVGDGAIPDLRFVDGVPDELGVTAGSPIGGGSLRSGASLSQTYTLAADRGVYQFDPVTLRARNLSGTRRSTETVEPSGEDRFECRVAIEDVPIRQDTTTYAGQLATDTGGPGIEFYATREYQPGDPVKRIDWNQYARTGSLSTVEYREQRVAHVAVITDSRPPAHVAATQTQPTGATLSAYAATLAVEVLAGEGHHVSAGALGIPDPETGTGPPAWVGVEERASFAAHAGAVFNAAATGTKTTDQRATAADDGAAGTAQPTPATDGGRQFQRLQAQLPAGAQVLLCSPVADDAVVDLVEQLRAEGHAVTVLSPQTAPGTVGGRVAALERAGRIDQLRMLGAAVVDWSREEKLPIALARTLETGVR